MKGCRNSGGGKRVQRRRWGGAGCCRVPGIHWAVLGGLVAALGVTLGLTLGVAGAWAHGPLFSAGPETIWKGGTEITVGLHDERARGHGHEERERETFLEIEYGITPDWEVSIELPYTWKSEDGFSSDGLGDVVIGTKYQFFVENLPGAQRKAAVFVNAKWPTADEKTMPPLGSGAWSVLGGLAVGYEGRRWYGFADVRYRHNGTGPQGLKKGDTLFLDVVGGVRPVLTEYDEPDTVLMLELNWERSARDQRAGVTLADTGGWQLFLSPVIWWTYRQVALKGGVQIPIASELNGDQPDADYRALFEAVYHF